MLVRISDEKYHLESNIPTEEKNLVVHKLLQEKLVFMEREMTIEEYFIETWNNPYTIKAMELLSYYLTKVSFDLETLSKGRMKEMSRGSNRHITLDLLGSDDQERLS